MQLLAKEHVSLPHKSADFARDGKANAENALGDTDLTMAAAFICPGV